MKRIKVPTILAITFLVLGFITSVLVVRDRQLFKSLANPSSTPHDIKITNISDNSLNISWVTDTATTGFVAFGTDKNLGQTALSDNASSSTIHYVNLQQLKLKTVYYFKINSNSTLYDNSGIPWQVATGASITGVTNNLVASGVVTLSNGQPASDTIIYISGDNINTLSAKTNTSGKWVLPLSSARVNDLNSFSNISSKATLLQIYAQGGSKGIATAQIYPEAANPTPSMILGNNYDFRTAQGSETTNSPSASVNLPQENSTASSSGFKITDISQSSSVKKVTIDSVNNGEVVKTVKPEFFGSASPGQVVNITVESSPQSTKLTVPSSGNWNWSPPSNLEPGAHTITISWTDASGVLRSLTRSFIVQAANEPAFVSTPSGTLKPTTTPIPTSTPTATPKATAIPTKSPSPTPTAPAVTPIPTKSPTPSLKPTATPASLPTAGETASTVALLSIALGLFGASVIAWKKIES